MLRDVSLQLVGAFGPAAVLLALVLVAGLLSPTLGGPTIDLPTRSSLMGGLRDGLAAGCLTLTLALLVSRVRAGLRAWRGEVVLGSPFGAAGRSLFRLLPRAVLVFAAMVFLHLLMPVFVGFKRAIPEFVPFGPHDVLLGHLDRALHAGNEPWRLLQPLVGRPWLTALIDLVYVRWYFVSIFALVSLVFWLRGERRTQFLIAFAAAWVFLGILVATGMSSVGPVYVDRLLGAPSAYTPLMAYLQLVNEVHPLHAIGLHEDLWTAYVTGDRGLVSGISAFPSMHVAMPALFALTVRHRSRTLSGVLWLYTTLIFVGSVHLGWHYAVDGYASILLIFPVWWASGPIARAAYARSRAWRGGREFEFRKSSAAGALPARGPLA
jgi:hypothetical protein